MSPSLARLLCVAIPRRFALFFSLAVAFAHVAFAVEYFDQEHFDHTVREQAGALQKAGTLLTPVQLAAQPTDSAPLTFAEPCKTPLDSATIYDHLSHSVVFVGYYYLCHHCNNWHLQGGTGFAVGPDVVSTCCHVLAFKPDDMREAYAFAADIHGRVYVVDHIVGANRTADTCLVHLTGAKLEPLALRTDPRVGEPVYCLGHPGSHYFVFTDGAVSRLLQIHRDGKPVHYLDVSCAYSPGSSGAPLVDNCGNVLAQVHTIESQMLKTHVQESGNREEAWATVFNHRMSTAADEITALSDPAARTQLPPPPAAKKSAPPSDSAPKTKPAEPDPKAKTPPDSVARQKSRVNVPVEKYDTLPTPPPPSVMQSTAAAVVSGGSF